MDCTPDVSGRRSSSPPPIRPDIHISAEGKFGEVLGVIKASIGMRARGIAKCSLPELCDRMTGHASLYASAFLPPPSGYKFGPRNRCTIQSTPEDLFEICSQFSLILIIRAEKKALRCRTTVSAKTFEIKSAKIVPLL